MGNEIIIDNGKGLADWRVLGYIHPMPSYFDRSVEVFRAEPTDGRAVKVFETEAGATSYIEGA